MFYIFKYLVIPLTLLLQPASYWYLKGFDIVKMEKYLDWFNMMTYDIRKSLCCEVRLSLK
jgi:chitinase